jgi:hypothetical protein
LYARKNQFFDAEEIALLEETADVCFVLELIKIKKVEKSRRSHI